MSIRKFILATAVLVLTVDTASAACPRLPNARLLCHIDRRVVLSIPPSSGQATYRNGARLVYGAGGQTHGMLYHPTSGTIDPTGNFYFQ